MLGTLGQALPPASHAQRAHPAEWTPDCYSGFGKVCEMKNLLLWGSSLAALLAVCGVAAAQDADPPSRVARIAYVSGAVSFEPATVDQWTAASLNYPMTTGDNLYTDSGGRAVLRIGQNSI